MSSDSNYEKLSDELQNKINTELFDGNGFKDNAIRRIDKEHDEPLFGGLRLCVTLKKLCTVHITTAMPTKHRYFLFIKTMIFHTVLCTFSLFQELREI